MFLISCENETEVAASSQEISLENTLNDDLSGQTGSVDDYFYDLSSDGIDAQYYYYDSILQNC